MMKALADRVHECGIPAEKLKVDVPPELEAMTEARMTEYAEKSKQNLETLLAEHRAKEEFDCNAGDGNACYRLAESAYSDAGDQGTEQVVRYLEFACEAGVGAGCRDIAEGYQQQGDAESLAAAVSYFKKACENKDVES